MMNKSCKVEFTAIILGAVLISCGCGTDNTQPPAQLPPAPETPSEVSAAEILIMYHGSQRASDEITRTQQEALALAKQLAERAREPDADFAALAKEHSDGPNAPRGGSLGNFQPNEMLGPLGAAVVELEIGEVSDPVESPFGYHVIRRQKLQTIQRAAAKHILVMYKGSMRAPSTITRTKDEALERISECLKRVEAGEKFEDLAREYSDGPTASRGGNLGGFAEGDMDPAFDAATFTCEVGKTTDIVETPFGYHIIYRYR
jgi:parvulin-like peptidyl-prolyl isomerase